MGGLHFEGAIIVPAKRRSDSDMAVAFHPDGDILLYDMRQMSWPAGFDGSRRNDDFLGRGEEYSA